MATILSGNYDHLQAAFDALTDGDTLVIAPGEYSGTPTASNHPLSPDGRGIYVLTPKNHIEIILDGKVIISPNMLSDGIFLEGCTYWSISAGLIAKNSYGIGELVDGRRTSYAFTTPLAHTGAIHLVNCSYITVDSPEAYDSEHGFHPEGGDHITLLNPNLHHNSEAGLRRKLTTFLTVTGGEIYQNGLYTNRVHHIIDPDPSLRNSGQGIVFYSGDDLTIDGVKIYDNQLEAISNYCGNLPIATSRIKITNCQLQSSQKGKVPMVWSWINMADPTWEFSNNGLWNVVDPTGGYLYISPAQYPGPGFEPPIGYDNPMPFAQMEAWLKTLNSASVGNYLLREVPALPLIPPRETNYRKNIIKAIRPGARRNEYGILVPGEEDVPFTLRGSVQPATGEESFIIPAGILLKDCCILYTRYEVKRDDRIELPEGTFRILDVAHWRNVLPHFEAFMVRGSLVDNDLL